MRTHEVTLTDGKPLSVRRLGLFELDNVASDKVDPGPFFYPIELAGGAVQEVPYDLQAVIEPPTRPERNRGEAEYKDQLWFEWQEYDIYQSAKAHERLRLNIARERLQAIAQHIMDTCIESHELDRIETVEDWEIVQIAAIAPHVTMLHIEQALTNSLGAKWKGIPLLKALKDLPSFGGELDSIRQWEIKLMMKLGKDETEYSLMAPEERARMIVADKVDDWMSALSQHEQSQKAKNKVTKKGR